MICSLFRLAVLLVSSLVVTASFNPGHHVKRSQYVANNYIIELKPGIDTGTHLAWIHTLHAQSTKRSQSIGISPSAGVLRNFKIDDLQGYAGEFDDTEIAAIRARNDVLRIERDVVLTVGDHHYSVSNPTGAERLEKRALVEQRNAPWPLAVVSQRPPVASNSTYFYDRSSGQGTYAYVLDTGINARHIEFGGRVFKAEYDAYPNESMDDANGHGTHVAGIIGSRTYGVAKRANLIDVRVVGQNGEGSSSSFMEGYAWAVNDILRQGRTGNAVVSMSLQGPRSESMNRAVKKAYDLGILTVVCAGNWREDVNNTSPASASEAITVAAIDQDANFTISRFSNFGSGVDLFAVGDDVLSTYKGSIRATARMSGTSMACPHVTGVALYLQALYKNLTAQKLRDKIMELASKGAVSGLPAGTPNNLVYNRSGK